MNVLPKSVFLKARVAPQLSWFLVHAPDEFSGPSEVELSRMADGVHIGQLARQLYSSGVLIDEVESEAALERTKQALRDRVPLFEAAFSANGMLCRCDVLLPTDQGWELLEVKASTRVKEDHLWDLAFQMVTLREAGLRIERAGVLHLDKEYALGEGPDLEGLFRVEYVENRLDPYLREVPAAVEAINKVIQGPRPHVKPAEALLLGGSWPKTVLPDLPRNHVTELYWSNGRELLEKGIESIHDIGNQADLTPKQQIQVEAIRSGTPYVDRDQIKTWLSSLQYPLYHLDFETFSSPVPVFQGTRPYQAIPFQFSLHIEQEDGRLDHYAYLHVDETDPRPDLIDQLKILEGEGSVVAHNSNFEKRVLRELLEFSPSDTWLDDAVNRLVDTIVPFQSFWFYHPDQRGSCSIKDVLPALVGYGYDDLPVSGGEEAALQFRRLRTGQFEPEEEEKIRRSLEEYCAQDTRAMVEIIRGLR